MQYFIDLYTNEIYSEKEVKKYGNSFYAFGTKVVVPCEKPINVAELDDGMFFIKDFGVENCSNLFILDEVPRINWKTFTVKPLKRDVVNFQRSFNYLRGIYFISKKKRVCFKVDQRGNHLLIKDNWSLNSSPTKAFQTFSSASGCVFYKKTKRVDYFIFKLRKFNYKYNNGESHILEDVYKNKINFKRR